MTDSNYSGNVDINIDPQYADYLADEAEQAQDEYEQARDCLLYTSDAADE